jgi:hypothetical protein
MNSNAWNDSFAELARDLAMVGKEWNNNLVPIISGLPDGSLDSTINTFKNGLDAKNLWVDQEVTSASNDLLFYSSSKGRPYTVEETLRNLYTYVDTAIAGVSESSSTGAGLSTEEEARIGNNIFDSTLVSSAGSLDGKSENNRLNTIQLAKDLYGPTYSLDNDGQGNLNNTVFAMVDALLELHNGNWDDDINISHSFTGDLDLNNNDILNVSDIDVHDNVTVSGEIRVETTIEAGSDIEITASGAGLILLGGDGRRWRLQVDNEGNLMTTSIT